MFQVNDVIVYGAQGVCKIAGIEEKAVNGVKRQYFVLKPVNDRAATIFAPTDNIHVLKKMRKLLTAEQIHALIDSMADGEATWIEDEAERRKVYKEIISGGDHRELIRLIKAIYAHKTQREAQGKRLHMSDERFFKDAEQILYNEFQYVLQLSSKDDLMTYILSRIQTNKA